MGLRSWRFPSQSSPNIRELVNKESYPLLQRNVLTPWRGLRSRMEERDRDTDRWKRTSLSSLIRLDEPQKTKADLSHAGTRLTRTLSVPDACSTSPLSGFSSITITARRVSLSGDLSSQVTRPVNEGEHLASSSTSRVSLNDDVSIKGHKETLSGEATMGKVPEDREGNHSHERFAGELVPSDHEHGATDSEAHSQANEGSSSPLASKRLFRSCAHLELLPCQSITSTFYLDRSLFVPLGGPGVDRVAIHRSTLSLYLGGIPLPSNPKKSKVPFRSSSEQNTVDFTKNGKGEQFYRLEDTASVGSRAGSSDVTTARAISAPLPFRARSHLSSAAVRLIGKANDVSGLPQSNRRGGLEGPVTSGGGVSSPRDNTAPRLKAETVTKVQECLVSPHVRNCTCGSSSSNQSHSLSLKEALELFRPDFISRSQRRLLRLEQMARQRRSLHAADLMGVESTIRRRNCTKPHPLSDNLFKPKDRVISGKEMQLRSRRIYNKLPEVTKKKEEEKRRLVLQTNRLRAEVFKKKLLDQILQRNSD